MNLKTAIESADYADFRRFSWRMVICFSYHTRRVNGR